MTHQPGVYMPLRALFLVYVSCKYQYLSFIYISFWYLLVLYVNLPPEFGSKWHFFLC